MSEPAPGARPAAKAPNLKPWAIGAALVVIAGVVAALVAGGGSSTSTANKVLAASETNAHGVHYRIVASVPNGKGPKQGPVPLYFDEYVGAKQKLLQRFAVPNANFYRDSVVASLKLGPSRDPNPEKTVDVVLSWYEHAGDQTAATKRYRATQQGIQLY
jgi:hypothetical protein